MRIPVPNAIRGPGLYGPLLKKPSCSYWGVPKDDFGLWLQDLAVLGWGFSLNPPRPMGGYTRYGFLYRKSWRKFYIVL